MMLATYLVIYSTIIWFMLRFGLVVIVSMIFFLNSLGNMELGVDWQTWYAPAGLASAGVLLALAMFAFWCSLGSRSLVGGDESQIA